MKHILCTLALCLSALTSWAGTGGITTHHQVSLTHVGDKVKGTRTSWIVYNLTDKDQLAFHGPDGIIRYGGKYTHKSLRNLAGDPKIGATTVNVGNPGGGDPPPKHEHRPTGVLGENGFTMYQTRWDGSSSATFVKDPFTCGSIFYSEIGENGAWRFDTANFVPCPAPSPVSSSGSVASPTWWDLIFWKSDGSPIQQQEITEWTDQMRLDYFKVYGRWPLVAK